MAPARTPGRNRREGDYSNVGIAGRKTGIVLKELGPRDENGLEPISELFSSPSKSALKPKTNGVEIEAALIEEEDMDTADSSALEPTEVLAAHRSRQTILPPPRARSPYKTALHSSPRRSIGPASSPMRTLNHDSNTPTRSTSHPAPHRRLDFSTNDRPFSVERSDGRISRATAAALNGSRKTMKTKPPMGRGKKRAFDLSITSDDDGNEEVEDEAGTPHASENEPLHDDPLPDFGGEDSLLPNGNTQIGDDSETHAVIEDNPENLPAEEDIGLKSSQAPLKKSKRGRKPKVKPQQDDIREEQNNEPEPAIEASSIEEMPISPQEIIPDISVVESENPALRKRGRPARVKLQETAHESAENAEAGSSRPAKRQRRGEVPRTPPPENKKKGRRLPPSERDPTAKVTAAANFPTSPSRLRAPSVSRASVSPSKRQSTFVIRSETPAEDNGAILLKSGRTSVKPAAFWRGERVVYGQGKRDGKKLELGGIREIIRTEEIIEERPTLRRRKGVVGRRPKLQHIEEEDEDQEEWEVDPGVLQAEVMRWDPVTQRGVEEEVEEIDLALAPGALQSLTREVKGAEFLYAKTITLPFFHSGMVDIPPQGEKRTKNSRKNHMIFWVFTGRVIVDVSGTRFSIGKGGMWQVPRGNFYAISNPYKQKAKIFFAQGCFMNENEIDVAQGMDDGEQGMQGTAE